MSLMWVTQLQIEEFRVATNILMTCSMSGQSPQIIPPMNIGRIRGSNSPDLSLDFVASERSSSLSVNPLGFHGQAHSTRVLCRRLL